MRFLGPAAPLVSSFVIATYLPLALVPERVLAQDRSEQARAGQYDDDTKTRLSRHLANDPGDASASANAVPDSSSEVAQAFNALPTPGGGAEGTGSSVSLPSGPSTPTGMGEGFSAQLSTGALSLSVPFTLASARGRVQPSLALAYNSGGGFGLAGVGWSVGGASISRQTERGVPGYDDRPNFHPQQDRFMFGGNELVPICTVVAGGCSGAPGEAMPVWANGWQYFRARIEGSFLRFFWAPNHLTWRVQARDGTNMELGVPLDGSNYQEALERNPDNRAEIYRWHLVRQYDSQGGANEASGPLPVNLIVYRYFSDGNVAYLSDIYDTSPANAPRTGDLSLWAHHTRLRYEPRPDEMVSYRSGWEMRYSLRLQGVDVTSKPFDVAVGGAGARTLTRRYHLGYDLLSHASLLVSVQPEGRCVAPVSESNESLPVTNCPREPAIRFEYQRVQSGMEPAFDGLGLAFERFSTTVRQLAGSPPHSLDERDVALLDAPTAPGQSGDGLLDLLVTSPGEYSGQHGLYLNGVQGVLGFGNARLLSPTGVPEVGAGDLRVSRSSVRQLDMDADGKVDLVHMPYVWDYEVFSLEHRGAEGYAWAGRRASTEGEDPKINFASDSADIRVVDVNADGLVDFVHTSPNEIRTYFSLGRYPSGDGKFGQGTWTSATAADLTNEPVRRCAPWSATAVRFSDVDTHLADVNGDGLPDLVRVRNGQVLYWPGRGNGFWGTGARDDCPGETFGVHRHIEMANPPFTGHSDPGRLLIADVNGDGFADMVEVRATDVDIYLNENGAGWTDRVIIENTPFLPGHASYVRLADIDGSGTPDLVWGRASDYRYIDLTGGVTPHLLVRSHNGVGRTTEFEYRSTTELMRDAAAAGTPWSATSPSVFPVLVKARLRNNLERVGRTPHNIVTEYRYRDPIFEGRQREFRGFRESFERIVGDANSPSSTTRTEYLLGECKSSDGPAGVNVCAPGERWRDLAREALKGLPTVVETFDDSGVYLSTSHTTYAANQLYAGLDGRRVVVAQPIRKDTFLYDTSQFDGVASHVSVPAVSLTVDGTTRAEDRSINLRASAGTVQTRSRTAFDNYGHVTDVFEDGCVAGCPGGGTDETYIAHSEYMLPAGDGSKWLWRELSSYHTGSIHTEVRNQLTHEYDAHGNRLRTRATLSGTLELDRSHAGGGAIAPPPVGQSGGTSAPVQIYLTTSTYDTFGHVTFKRGAGNGCASSELDPAYAHLVVTSRAYAGSLGAYSCGQTALVKQYVYDRGLERVTDSVDVAGQPTRYVYDGFGRTTSITGPDPDAPGTLASRPSTIFTYDVPLDPSVRPYTVVRIQAQDGAFASDDSYRESWVAIDGLGGRLAAADMADPSAGDAGDWVLSGRVEVNAKGLPQRACDPEFYTGTAMAALAATPPAAACVTKEYDAFGRTVNTYNYDHTLRTNTRYRALSVDVNDALDFAGPRRDTPHSEVANGHGQVILSIDRLHVGLAIEEHRTRFQYLPTGEITRVTRQRDGSPEVVRWLRYDSLGRLVLNVEPNTSPNFTANDTVSASSVKALRYAYNDSGQLVGTSDSRGCGVNFHYDTGGRPVAVDYSPCEAHQPAYTSPNLTTGDGTEIFYRYDTADPDGASIVNDAGTPFPINNALLIGQLASVSDRGTKAVFRYDARARNTGTAIRLARTGMPASTLSQRYTDRWYTRDYVFDGADRIKGLTTGATSPQLQGTAGLSAVFYAYAKNGSIASVASSYGTLLQGRSRHADGRVKGITLGDAAGTQRAYAYDQNHRLQTVQTFRSNLTLWTSPPIGSPYVPNGIGDPPTTQMLLEDTEYGYDEIGNLVQVDDYRVPSDWPTSAKPVSRTMGYDDLYQLTSISYDYGGADPWSDPYAAEVANPTRVQPGPRIAQNQRILAEAFEYDYLGNMTRSTDDASAFWDRSTGARTHGSATAGPNQLRTASNRVIAPGSTRKGDLEARYNAAGQVTELIVKRDGVCIPTGASCWQRFHYEWDEIGNISRARRWDIVGLERTDLDPLPARAPDAELHYSYSGSQRVRKTAIDALGAERHTLYPFDTLEVRSTTWDTVSSDFVVSALTEQVRLPGPDMSARLVYTTVAVPHTTTGGLHVFLQFADRIGSGSFSVDKDTSELVEYTTYTSYGSVESSYRPERWDSVREPYKFTGKEEDIEVGLVYFGDRYYSPYAAVWMSPDPVNLHQLGSDRNPYGYVERTPMMGIDPDGRYGWIEAIVIAAVAAAVAITASIVTQAVRFGWSDINWGVRGVLGAGIVGFAAGLVGGYAGMIAGPVNGIGAGIAVGAIAGAASGATAYLVGAGIRREPVTWGGLGKSVLTGAVSGAISGGFGASDFGATWAGDAISSIASTGASMGVSAAMGGTFTVSDFALSMGQSVASSMATHGYSVRQQNKAIEAQRLAEEAAAAQAVEAARQLAVMKALSEPLSVPRMMPRRGIDPRAIAADFFLTYDVDLVGPTGVEFGGGIVLDIDSLTDWSLGVFVNGGPSAGLNAGVGFGGGFVLRDIEGWGTALDINGLPAWPVSGALMFDGEGFNGGALTVGPGGGLSFGATKTETKTLFSSDWIKDTVKMMEYELYRMLRGYVPLP